MCICICVNEHTEDYHINKLDDENFLFEIEYEKYIYVRDKVVSFKSNDNIITYCLKLGYNDIKYPYAYGDQNIYFMLHQKYVTIRK